MSEDQTRADELVTEAAAEQPEPQAPATEPEPETAEPVAARPEGIPEKFWDSEAGALRTDSLLKSYLELERKLGAMVPVAGDEGDLENNKRLRRLLGVPDSAEGYRIEPASEILEPDPVVNAKLHEAGFNQRQAQLVYDLAADYMLPLIGGALSDLEAARDAERLADRFGGKDAWAPMARQIKTWGEANLPAEVMQVLASNYDGVIAMHHMMQATEPSVLRHSDGASPQPNEAELTQKMRDPRYWRDRNPAFVAEVTEGFMQLYPS